MRQYREYPKQAIIAAMRRRRGGFRLSGAPAPASGAFVPSKGPSIFDISKWPQWWEAGAKELEKTAPGKIVTAPIRIPAAVVESTEKTVKEVPGTVRTVSRSIPIIAVAAVLIGGGYIAYKTGVFEKIKQKGV